MSDTTVSKYEREASLPDSAMLIDIADAIDIDLSYFLRVPRVGAIEPAYRKRASILEVDALDFNWPESVPYRVASMDEVEQAALDLRAAWNIGMDPIENLTERLEEHALRVGALPAPGSFDACAL